MPLVEAAFPHTVWGGAVDRPRLAARVFSDPAGLKVLEGILHPLVHQEERRFLQRQRRRRKSVVALDIPLLFETGGDRRCDAVAVLTCPAFLQEQRVMARHGMTTTSWTSSATARCPTSRSDAAPFRRSHRHGPAADPGEDQAGAAGFEKPSRQDCFMREIVLDTETTGLDPASGHRVVEIGCVELLNHMPTGRVFHRYINPERDMPDEAFKVHGLSEEFLSAQPLFADVAQEFIEFVADDPLVIHNAEFDMKFLNWELKILAGPRCRWIVPSTP